MNNEERYEIKFVLDEAKLAEFNQWMFCSTELRSVYTPRCVNSLYFDDTGFGSVRDNITGVAQRRKIRLRWYRRPKSLEFSSPVLEIKYRNGRLGSKRNIPLPALQEGLSDTEVGSLVSDIGQQLQATDEFRLLQDDHYCATLHVEYLRDYYADERGLRVTIDQEVDFYQVSPFATLFSQPSRPYPVKIVELKFSLAVKPRVVELMRSLHLTPKRHSKYLAGLAAFGLVNYI